MVGSSDKDRRAEEADGDEETRRQACRLGTRKQAGRRDEETGLLFGIRRRSPHRRGSRNAPDDHGRIGMEAQIETERGDCRSSTATSRSGTCCCCRHKARGAARLVRGEPDCGGGFFAEEAAVT